MTNYQLQSIADRSLRSVFVGNIPYEATEEQLKDIFSEAGPVISFRLVFDRDSGKPKGYGFCEYKDQETALSAMRNLNGYEFNGRQIRVDNAANEKNREELRCLAAMMGPPVESPFGADCEPGKAPEAISKAVASLPPEQMFELMKQMKICIQNNPNEAKNMLLQNPQLAYALLQAQVVMRIIDPQTALSMLHGKPEASKPPGSANDMGPGGPPVGINAPPVGMGGPPFAGGPMAQFSGPMGMMPVGGPGMGPMMGSGMGPRPLLGPGPGPMGGPGFNDKPGPRDFDMRDLRGMGDRDMRMPPGGPMGGVPRDPRGDRDLRPDPRVHNEPNQDQGNFDPRFRGGPGPVRGGFTGSDSPYDREDNSAGLDSRDPRANRNSGGIPKGVPPPAGPSGAVASSVQDQEKAALIMQVLQLSDAQIAMLPPEQRQSIMVLKEQIARQAQTN